MKEAHSYLRFLHRLPRYEKEVFTIPRKVWTDKHDSYLIMNYNRQLDSITAKVLGRSKTEIRRRMVDLGLKRIASVSPLWIPLAEVGDLITREGYDCSRATIYFHLRTGGIHGFLDTSVNIWFVYLPSLELYLHSRFAGGRREWRWYVLLEDGTVTNPDPPELSEAQKLF